VSSLYTCRAWPIYRGDLGRTGYSEEEISTSFKLAKSTQLNTPLSPIVEQDGRVFVGSGNKLLCIDLTEFRILWSFEASNYFAASPCVQGDAVIAAAMDGYIRYFKADTGELLWLLKCGGGVIASPLIWNEIVFVASMDSRIYAFNISGENLWIFRTGGRITSSPALKDNILYVASLYGNVYAINDLSGEHLWKKNVGVIKKDLMVFDKVYVISNNKVLALDVLTGKKIWSRRFNVTLDKSLATDYENIYVAAWDTVYALAKEDGSIIWSTRLDGRISSSPVVLGDYIIVCTYKGNLSCISNTDGSIASVFSIESYVISSPTFFKDGILAATYDGKLLKIEWEKVKFDFALSVSPATIEINQGEAGAITVTVSKVGGEAKPVYLTLSGLPSEASYSFDPVSVTPPGSSKLTINAGSAKGTYTVTIKGVADGIERTTTFTVVFREKKCVIATVTYGSEVSDEVNLLRKFRDEIVLNSYAGQRFYVAFDAFYYSWSPYVAQFIIKNPWLKTPVKILLYPLLGALLLASHIVQPISYFNHEIAVYAAGTVIAVLLGIIYVSPLVLLFYYIAYLKKAHLLLKVLNVLFKLKYALIGCLIIVVIMAITHIFKLDLALTIATSMYVLSVIHATSILIVKILTRQH